jgi:hypothetical protein
MPRNRRGGAILLKHKKIWCKYRYYQCAHSYLHRTLEMKAYFRIMIPKQYCGSGSGIRCLFDPWIRDSGWVKSQDPDPGWKQFGSGMEKSRIRHPGSGINIPDPQHCSEMPGSAIKLLLDKIRLSRSGSTVRIPDLGFEEKGNFCEN